MQIVVGTEMRLTHIAETDIVVEMQLQMSQQGDTCTEVHARVGVFPFPVDVADVIGHIEGKLRASKEKQAGHASEPYSIAQIERDGNLLDIDGLIGTHNLLVAHIHSDIRRDLIVQGRCIETQSGKRKSYLQGRSDVEARLVGRVDKIALQRQAGQVKSTFHSKLHLRLCRGKGHYSQQHQAYPKNSFHCLVVDTYKGY